MDKSRSAYLGKLREMNTEPKQSRESFSKGRVERKDWLISQMYERTGRKKMCIEGELVNNERDPQQEKTTQEKENTIEVPLLEDLKK